MPSSLSLDAKIKDSDNFIKIQITSLDNICIPLCCDKKVLIKIDVEGTEVDIFTEGLKTLKNIGPNIICEVLPEAKEYLIYDNLLESNGYNKYLITDCGLKKFDRIVPHKLFKDWLFTKESDPIEGVKYL
jgi:hypothetical protein